MLLDFVHQDLAQFLFVDYQGKIEVMFVDYRGKIKVVQILG